MPDFEELCAGLRRWTASHDNRVRAAVELLIWHETFLRRADFFRAAVGAQGDVFYIRWDRARQFVSSAGGVSSSQSAVLLLAAWIAEDPFGMSGFGRAHRQAAVDAFAAALGVTSLTGERPAGTPALGARIAGALKAGGFDASGEVPPFLAGFTVTEVTGATVGIRWLDASPEDRAQLLERYGHALEGDGLRVDVYANYLYVHDPVKEAHDAG